MPPPFWRSREALDRLNRPDRPVCHRIPAAQSRLPERFRRQVAQGALDLQAARSELVRRWGATLLPLIPMDRIAEQVFAVGGRPFR
jgi:hypothetical protein